jgi:hypothetical protein
VARIEEARPRRHPEPSRHPEPKREHAQDSDTSHLPAFLLRPVRAKA